MITLHRFRPKQSEKESSLMTRGYKVRLKKKEEEECIRRKDILVLAKHPCR